MYPRLDPYDERLIAVDGAELFVEQSGNPDGIPALYLHGGPGSGLGNRGYVMKFDPERYRVIGLDQRGCGRSRPWAMDDLDRLDRLTTPRLIDDVEAVRKELGVEAWVVNGVSWGSTLALAYAQAHPERVLGIVIMAVTTGAPSEIDWITEGVGALYPEAWDRFAGFAEGAGVGYRRGEGRIVEAYARLMRDPDLDRRRAASRAWADWEDAHVAIGAGGLVADPRWDDERYRVNVATLITHFWSHDCFLEPPVLAGMGRLARIPGTLVHGRLDVSGPAGIAWDVHQRWPGSELIIEEREGHGGERMVEAWCAANSALARRLRSGRG